MTCPVCGGKTHIVDSRSDGETVRRRRECLECKHRFTTKEIDVNLLDKLLKTAEKTRDVIQNQLGKIKSLIEQAQGLNY